MNDKRFSTPAPRVQDDHRDEDDESPPHHEAPPISPEAAPARWVKRRFIGERETPEQALTWKTTKGKGKHLKDWRYAVGKQVPESGRMLRIAWGLEGLFGKHGYAFPTDGYLSRVLEIPVNKIQAGLTELERAGAIVRASVFVNGKPERRIWPSSQILKSIPPNDGGCGYPPR